MTKSHEYPADQVRDAITDKEQRKFRSGDYITQSEKIIEQVREITKLKKDFAELETAYNKQYAELCEYHGLLEEFATSLVAMDAWQDYEAGMDGNGEIVRAYKLIGIPLPEEITEWLNEKYG